MFKSLESLKQIVLNLVADADKEQVKVGALRFRTAVILKSFPSKHPVLSSTAQQQEAKKLFEELCEQLKNSQLLWQSVNAEALATVCKIGLQRPAFLEGTVSTLLHIQERAPKAAYDAAALQEQLLKLARGKQCAKWADKIAAALTAMGAGAQLAAIKSEGGRKRSNPFGDGGSSDGKRVKLLQHDMPMNYPPVANELSEDHVNDILRNVPLPEMVNSLVEALTNNLPPPPPVAMARPVIDTTQTGQGSLNKLLSLLAPAPPQVLSSLADLQARVQQSPVVPPPQLQKVKANPKRDPRAKRRRQKAPVVENKNAAEHDDLGAVDGGAAPMVKPLSFASQPAPVAPLSFAQARAPAVPDVTAPMVLKKLTPAKSKQQMDAALKRLMGAERGAKAAGQQQFWAMLLSRISCNMLQGTSIEDTLTDGEKAKAAKAKAKAAAAAAKDMDERVEMELKEVAYPLPSVVKYILEDYPSRHSLAITLLYQEYARAMAKSKAVDGGTKAEAAVALTAAGGVADVKEEEKEEKEEKKEEKKETEGGAAEEPSNKAEGGGGDDTMDTSGGDGATEEDEEAALLAAAAEKAAKEAARAAEADKAFVPPAHLRTYTHLAVALLRGMESKLGAGSPLVSELLVEAPSLQLRMLSLVWEYCGRSGNDSTPNKGKVLLGLKTMFNLINRRQHQPYRDACLQCVLLYTKHPEKSVRTPAIQLTANILYSVDGGALAPSIEKHATRMISFGAEGNDKNENEEEEEGVKEEEEEEEYEPADEDLEGAAAAGLAGAGEDRTDAMDVEDGGGGGGGDGQAADGYSRDEVLQRVQAMKVTELRAALTERGCDEKGLEKELVERLADAIYGKEQAKQADGSADATLSEAARTEADSAAESSQEQASEGAEKAAGEATTAPPSISLEQLAAVEAEAAEEATRVAAWLSERAMLADAWLYPETGTKERLELYLALCGKKQSLVHGLLRAYTKAPEENRKSFHIGVEQLVKFLKKVNKSAAKVVGLIANFPPGAEQLVLVMLHSLCPPGELCDNVLVQTFIALYRSKRVGGDARFLVPAVQSLPKDEFLTALPNLICLPVSQVREVFMRLLASPTRCLTPQQLFVHLVRLFEWQQPAVAGLTAGVGGGGGDATDEQQQEKERTLQETQLAFKQHVKDALKLCFGSIGGAYFTQQVLGEALQQMAQMEHPPKLLMWAVIQTYTAWPDLKKFILGAAVMGRLLLPSKKVWAAQDTDLWIGVKMCLKQTQPQSFQLILELPPPQLREVMTQFKDMQEPLTKFASVPSRQNKLSNTTLEVLGLQRMR
jgi:hypothetical protein